MVQIFIYAVEKIAVIRLRTKYAQLMKPFCEPTNIKLSQIKFNALGAFVSVGDIYSLTLGI